MLGEVGGSRMANVLKAADDMLKTPEQLEEEKRVKLEERIPKFDYDKMSHWQLVTTAEKLYKQLVSTTYMIYDLGERQQRQKYDMAELAERGRQLERNKNKVRSKVEPTGLGGPIFTKLQEFFPQAPPKVSLFSRFERVIDRRTLAERREFFNNAKMSSEERVSETKKQSKFVVQTERNVKKKKARKQATYTELVEEPKEVVITKEEETKEEVQEEKVEYHEPVVLEEEPKVEENLVEKEEEPVLIEKEEEVQEITHHENDVNETESEKEECDELEELEENDEERLFINEEKNSNYEHLVTGYMNKLSLVHAVAASATSAASEDEDVEEEKDLEQVEDETYDY